MKTQRHGGVVIAQSVHAAFITGRQLLPLVEHVLHEQEIEKFFPQNRRRIVRRRR